MSDPELFGRLVELFTNYLGRSEPEVWELSDPEAELLDISTSNYAFWQRLPARNVHPSERVSIEQRWNDGVNTAKRLYVQFYHRSRGLEQTYDTVNDARRVFNDTLMRKSTSPVAALAVVNRQG